MCSNRINLEHELFSKLSREWWDENGKFKVLHQIRPLRIEYILKQIDSKKMTDLDVLDLGCGGGLISESLSRLNANVTGVDFVKNNIEVAKRHALKKKLKINYIQDDIEKLRLAKKFDLIIIFEVLEHLNDWQSFLIKIKKNLKRNGIIIISTINRNILSKYLAIYFAENILKWVPKGTHSYEKFIKPSEIYSNMINNNFRLKNLSGLKFNLLQGSWKLSRNPNINYFCTYSLN